jgi:hypothetical protein
MRELVAPLAALIAAGLAHVMLAQTALRTRVDGVRLDVLVRDGDRAVEGLSADDFEVIDGGVTQTITAASIVGELSVALLLDGSRSVARSPQRGALIRAADAVIAALSPRDQAALLTFETATAVVVPATRERDLLYRGIRTAEAAPMPRRFRETAFWDAILIAAGAAKAERGRTVVWVLSDGGDNASWTLRNWPAEARANRLQHQQFGALLRSAGVVVDVAWIPLQRSPWGWNDDIFQDPTPREPAAMTDGIDLLATRQDLPERIAARLTALRAGYVLTYVPVAGACRNGESRIQVRIKNRRSQITAPPSRRCAEDERQ